MPDTQRAKLLALFLGSFIVILLYALGGFSLYLRAQYLTPLTPAPTQILPVLPTITPTSTLFPTLTPSAGASQDESSRTLVFSGADHRTWCW
ncbi:MAG: hypothetical protein ACYC5M_02000 [Anaerolineae bacterium]